MKSKIPVKSKMSGQNIQIISLAFLLTILFLPARESCAANLNDCLMKALNDAGDSVTVGQLREQCRQNTGKGPDGPAEIVLKTSQARKPAYFPHKVHQGKYACGTCHHEKDASGGMVKYTEKTNIYQCVDCHNAEMPNKELNSFQAIGHALCRDCHRKNQDITSATCSTCHRKNLK